MVSESRVRNIAIHYPITAGSSRVLSAAEAEAPLSGDRWPLWKTLTFIIIYCSLAWGLIGTGIWLLLR